jgi:prepilin-type N-terminal cleavage/methylation domain-containing protein
MKKGFTLIELLAVIVILAVILAITVPSISNVMKNSTKSAFESDAKMVLKAADYKKLEDSSFVETLVNQDNVDQLLGLSKDNYSTLKITIEDNIPIITIVGKKKWNGLVACGTYTNIRVVENESDCGTDLIPPVITLNGNSIVSINIGEIYSDAGSSAIDNTDGDITNKIVTSGTVNTSIPGSYSITYTVTDTAGNTSTVTRTVKVLAVYAGPNYIEDKGVNGPALAQGMTPIKWDGSTWIDTTINDAAWYNYDTTAKVWANARTADGSMWVWIPRYIYKISSGWHSNTTGTIVAQFSKGTDDNWNSSVIGNIDTDTTSNASNNKWTNHSSFDFGSTKLTGIWVAKFEASAAEGVANGYTSDETCPTVGDDVTTKTVKIVPNVASWRCINVNNTFTAIRNMETKSVYGWGTTGVGIDTHLMENTEWGAVSYLTQSNYGKNAGLWINNSSTYTTGCAGSNASDTAYSGCKNSYNTVNGNQASTTGNIYGIYDLSGSAWERIAAYVNNGNANLNKGLSLVNATAEYKNLYMVGTPDDQPTNYSLAINFKGDAVYETSSNINGSYSWYNGYSYMINTVGTWFVRGGSYAYGSAAGIFNYANNDGGGYSSVGFRPVLVVNAGL